MNLQNISDAELVNRMQKLVRTERKITHLILLHILEIESRRIYADLGYDGMYTYLTRGLGYSEASAYRRLQSARLLKRVPEVAEKIESGALHLSQLTQIQKCLRASAEKGALISSAATLEVLEKLENKNSFETDMVLAREFDLPVKAQIILKPQQDGSVRMEMSFTAEQFRELSKSKDFLSHVCVDGSWPEIIETLAKKFNRTQEGPTAETVSPSLNLEPNNLKRDVVIDNKEKQSENQTTQTVIAKRVARRKTISLKLKRVLLKKADSCCEHVNPETGHRCGSRYQLQIDHIKPVAFGGKNNPENLRILCRTHNLFVAMQMGLVKMSGCL